MKKSLVLAMAMALGVTASAYAANPFSDVPAGHWAYDSISKLAAAGVIEGYGDDTFRGDRLMTRYEMAQIVAKAMAKGANVDKLAAEFADELDALGVRVAALEKKADNVKINGQIRYRWAEGTPVNGVGTQRRRQSRLRSRIWLNGQVNDGWKYTMMFQNQQEFARDDDGEENTDFQRAFVTGRVGGVKVEAGRNQVDLIGGDSDVYSNRMDRIVLSYGNKGKISGWYGKPTALNAGGAVAGNYGKAGGVRLSYDWDKIGAYFEYDKLARGNRGFIAGVNNTWDIWGIGANAKFGDFGVNALFLHGKLADMQDYKKNGWTLNLTYKGANKAKPGTWGLGVKYYDQGVATFAPGMHGTDAYLPVNAWGSTEGFKGIKLQADYTAAKNMVASIMYFDLKEKAHVAPGVNKAKAKTALAQMVWTF